RSMVLSGIALFCVLCGQRALAQVLPVTCSTNVSTPILRGEGYTEEVGDITVSCVSGEVNPPLGSSIPAVNITIFLNTAVTSRLLPSTASGNSTNQSEALLTIDEPGSGLPNPLGPGVPFGVDAPLTVCPTSASGCTE